MDSFVGMVVIVVGFVAMVCAISLLFAWPLQLLWNGCLVGAVDGVHSVSVLQMWGLSFLFGMLFKSSGSSKSAS